MRLKLLVVTLLCSLAASFASPNAFTVIIDPGHGGKDPGALGNNGREKDINLKVALLLGDLIKENHPTVKVCYTRTTDTYVTLQERSSYANKMNGDLFICIHTNASKSRQAYGAETFTLGLSKSNANFEVAKRENSVILLEEDYKEKYQGFDPTSPESYIMFEFMQSKYVEQSVDFAYNIQKEFSGKQRSDRGVRQEIFWVLHQTKMPSVLVELGFITNNAEEQFLLSKKGQETMANCVYNAFDKYKHEYDRKSNGSYKSTPTASKETNKPSPDSAKNKVDTPKVISQPTSVETAQKKDEETTAKVAQKVEFRVQIFTTSHKLKAGDSNFKGLKNYNYYVENGTYKYTYGSSVNFQEIIKIKNEVSGKFPSCFVIAFLDGKKVSVGEARKLTKQ